MTFTPSADSRDATSADCAMASARTLAYRRAASTRTAPFRSELTSSPRPGEASMAAIIPELAMSVFDGTQSVSTQAPPRPSRSTTVTSAPSCAATRAASYPPGPPPIIAILACGWLTPPIVAQRSGPDDTGHHDAAAARLGRPPIGRTRTLINRVDVCRVRREHGPGADGQAVPALTGAGHRLARGLAADIRRCGPGLGGSPADGRRGERPPGIRRPV